LFSSFTAVLQLYCCSPVLLLFSRFSTILKLYRTAVKLENSSKTGEQLQSSTILQLYCCSPVLLLFSSYVIVLQFYYCSPVLLLFSKRTVVKLENNSKAGEQQ
jgi:hypothetical protein